MEWKKQVESSSVASFVKVRRDNKIGNVTRRQYYCHRSGRARVRGRGLKHIKIQGTCKTNQKCPAAMFVRIVSSGKPGVFVTYYYDHFGHECDVAHQQLSREQRREIAGMLATGIPFDDVLHRIQLSGDNTKVSRLHLLSKQDLKNILRDFNLSRGVTYHANDADSVAAWVAQNQADGDRSMVRFVKFPGAEDVENNLTADDFVLVIMSEAQIAALQQSYRQMSEIAMDSTHGTNSYDYQLTTIMIIDDHAEGFPVAFCFSNRVDEGVMRLFLTVCKNSVGRCLEQAILMTDDTEVYSNAWNYVMGQPAHRLLCT